MTLPSNRNIAPTLLRPAPPIDTGIDSGTVRVSSPVGCLEVEATTDIIIAVRWIEGGADDAVDGHGLLAEARRQLKAYFAGQLKVFDLPLAPAGSPFERDVWRLMCDIPYGDIMTYGEMAQAVGGVARAVGGACGANPIPVIIPCHRVLGAGNRMVGYSGRGHVETKRWLLVHEGALLV